jgi:hypothetical protein
VAKSGGNGGGEMRKTVMSAYRINENNRRISNGENSSKMAQLK